MLLNPDDLRFETPRGFVVLEGVNGGGKSTLQMRLANFIEERGIHVVCTREPGGTTLGRELRAILQEGRLGKISEKAELLLFAADRAQHVEEIITPALARKMLVLSDRFFYSTVAFQGFGRGIDRLLIDRINDAAVGECLPDVVLLLDLDPEEGLRRNRETGEADTFEEEDLAFHRRIREGFLTIAREAPTPFVLIDATRPKEEVFEEAKKVIKLLLAAREAA